MSVQNSLRPAGRDRGEIFNTGQPHMKSSIAVQQPLTQGFSKKPSITLIQMGAVQISVSDQSYNAGAIVHRLFPFGDTMLDFVTLRPDSMRKFPQRG